MLSALAPTYALVLATPGPNLLVILRAGLSGAARALPAAAIGIACGAGLAAASAGLAAFLLTRGLTFDVHAVEIAGRVVFAALLARAGLRMLRGSGRPAMLSGEAVASGHFRLGLVTALCNPLTVPFLAAFFLSHGEAHEIGAGLAAGGLVMLMAGGWFALVGLLLARARTGFTFARTDRWPRLTIGLALLACAAATIWPLCVSSGTPLVADGAATQEGQAGLSVQASDRQIIQQLDPVEIGRAKPHAPQEAADRLPHPGFPEGQRPTRDREPQAVMSGRMHEDGKGHGAFAPARLCAMNGKGSRPRGPRRSGKQIAC